MFSTVVKDTWYWDTRSLSDLGTTATAEGSISDLCRYYFNFDEPTASSELQLGLEPSEVRVTYEDDLNLRILHQIVREKIICILQKLERSDSDLKCNDIAISDKKLPPIDVKDLYRKTAEIISFKKKYMGINLWEQYKNSVIPILNKYTPLMSNEFIGNSSSGMNCTIDESKLQERLKYIKQYIDEINKLNIVKFIPVKIQKYTFVCPSCLKNIQQESLNEENGKYLCNCGFTDNTVKHISEYIDGTKSAVQSLPINADIKIIQTWIDRYLCRSGEKYRQEEMFPTFDSYCAANNLPNRWDVLNGNVQQPEMQIIIFLLQNNKFSNGDRFADYYGLKNQIRHDYYGYPVQEISQVQESTIISLYINFQNKYMVSKKRKTSINIEILGCVFLILAGVNVNVCDFKIPASSETLAYSHQSVIDVLLELGYNMDNIPNVLRLFS